MARNRLPPRRRNFTQVVTVPTGSKTKDVLVTFGFDADNKIREIFCADFKAGTDLHAIVTDVCILFSRLLQHGDSAADISEALSPSSMIGAIAEAALKVERDVKASVP